MYGTNACKDNYYSSNNKTIIKNINADYLISALTVLENSSPHLMVYALNNIYASSFDF